MKASAGQPPARPRIVLADDFVGLFGNLPELAGLREIGEVVRHAERPSDERALAGRLAGGPPSSPSGRRSRGSRRSSWPPCPISG